MEMSDGRRCSVCGALIGDNNPDGIGASCRKAYHKATEQVFFEDEKRRNAYYGALYGAIAKVYIAMFKNTKFRSDFRKKFYPSIKKQFAEKGFVSSKQAKIMKEMMIYKDSSWSFYPAENRNPKYKNALKKQQEIKENWKRNMSEEDQKHVVNLANKLRHE